MADVVCLGELLIDFVPTVTGTDLISAPAFKKAPGGAPANVLRLGANSGLTATRVHLLPPPKRRHALHTWSLKGQVKYD